MDRSDFHCFYANQKGGIFYAGEVTLDFFDTSKLLFGAGTINPNFECSKQDLKDEALVELRGPFPSVAAGRCFMDGTDVYECSSCKRDVALFDDGGGCHVYLKNFFGNFTKIEDQ